MHQPAAHRLKAETSPYLQQHAENPVEWFPWGEEALQHAREQDRPILLSIGYSACHWCHVMAHESFEDPATAAVMNRLFVNIKVDREERPDLDKIYQSAHQLLNQRGGGWPLTVFLAPDDLTPFFAGTYFPAQARHGLPAFVDLLTAVDKFFGERREDVRAQNLRLRDYLQSVARGQGSGQGGAKPVPDAAPLTEARRQLGLSFDAEDGGFGSAPKFPHPTHIERLLRHWAASRSEGPADDEALQMATQTLQAMAAGGIFDQLGGGFCRYSVDAGWSIPHFEKMLYDNGPLLALYAEAACASDNADFRRVATQTAEWVMREMQAPEGGYYSALDADSEGEEGRFYVWTPAQVRERLTADEYAVLAPHYGLDSPANFEGQWHLRLRRPLSEVAAKLGLDEAEARRRLDTARASLLAAREQRVRPGRDEKILTSWNGLMIRGMAVAGLRLGRPDFIASAERALNYVRDSLWRDGRLLATAKDGRAHLSAYLDDYAFLADGILALLQARWRDQDLQLAVELMEVLLAHFRTESGGFYFTADDHEALIQRPAVWADDAMPSGNGVAAQVLLRLGYLLGNARYLAEAEAALSAAWQDIAALPHGHNALLHALEEWLSPTEVVVVRGPGDKLSDWTTALAGDYAPRRLTLGIPSEATPPGMLAAHRPPADGRTQAWVCRDGRCLPAVDSPAALRALLAE